MSAESGTGMEALLKGFMERQEAVTNKLAEKMDNLGVELESKLSSALKADLNQSLESRFSILRESHMD